MNVNSFKSIIVVLLSLLCAYMYWSLCSDSEDDGNRILIVITGFVTSLCTFGGALALEYEDTKHAVNAKIASWTFAILFIILHVTFALVGIKQSSLIISSGIIILLFILIIYKINRIKM